MDHLGCKSSNEKLTAEEKGCAITILISRLTQKTGCVLLKLKSEQG
jgi:hypothetical protein